MDLLPGPRDADRDPLGRPLPSPDRFTLQILPLPMIRNALALLAIASLAACADPAARIAAPDAAPSRTGYIGSGNLTESPCINGGYASLGYATEAACRAANP